MIIFKGLASVCVDHGVGVVCVAMLGSDEVPSGLRIMGAGVRRKTGWMGPGAGVCCNIMWLLRGTGLLMAVRPEAVAGDRIGVNFSPLWSGLMTCRWTGRDTVVGDGGLDVGVIFTLRADGGMFTLGDAGGTVTLGDAGVIVTRRDGGVIVRTAVCVGTMMGSAVLAMALSNILARSTMACCWASPNWENGAAGTGLVSASVRARAVMIALLTEDVLGTGHW